MSEYKFSATERWAVFTTHGQRCYLCKRSLDLRSMHIDHILPEKLASDRYGLLEALNLYGLSQDFCLNSYENWLPACGPCNLSKKDMIFEPTPIIQVELQRARLNAEKARAAAVEVVRNRSLHNALNTVLRSIEGIDFDYNTLRPLVIAFIRHNPEAAEALLRVEAPSNTYNLRPPRPIFRITPEDAFYFGSNRVEFLTIPKNGRKVSSKSFPRPNFRCPTCGAPGPWIGARCIHCSHFDENYN